MSRLPCLGIFSCGLFPYDVLVSCALVAHFLHVTLSEVAPYTNKKFHSNHFSIPCPLFFSTWNVSFCPFNTTSPFLMNGDICFSWSTGLLHVNSQFIGDRFTTHSQSETDLNVQPFLYLFPFTPSTFPLLPHPTYRPLVYSPQVTTSL